MATWIDKFVNKLPIELHAVDPVVGQYSSLGPGTKHMDRIQKYMEAGDKEHIAKNDLDLTTFCNDNAYSKYKTAPERKDSDLKLIDDAWKIAKNKHKNGYERLYATRSL